MVTPGENISVKKRNGRGDEPLNIEKIHDNGTRHRGYIWCIFFPSRNE